MEMEREGAEVTDYIRVESCQFRRKKNSKWETGVTVNEGHGPIIDVAGKVVKSPVWDWRTTPEHVMTVTVESE
jgi:hypothetical protein